MSTPPKHTLRYATDYPFGRCQIWHQPNFRPLPGGYNQLATPLLPKFCSSYRFELPPPPPSKFYSGRQNMWRFRPPLRFCWSSGTISHPLQILPTLEKLDPLRCQNLFWGFNGWENLNTSFGPEAESVAKKKTGRITKNKLCFCWSCRSCLFSRGGCCFFSPAGSYIRRDRFGGASNVNDQSQSSTHTHMFI